MHENECGTIVRQQWFESAQIRPELELDAFTVMPNHLHGILWIVGPNGVRPLSGDGIAFGLGRAPLGPTNRIPAMRPHSLASWASGFKSAVTSGIRKHWKKPRAIVWQEDYFEHVIRDEDELNRIRDYILSNPARWRLDRENPEAGPDVEDEWPWTPDDVP
jgi:REP element-mobilizing transposase RayT